MAKVQPGERLAILPFANSPAFENVTDEAEIKVSQLTLRGYYTMSEREKIWGKHQDGTQMGLTCIRRKCPRCAGELLLKNRVLPDPSPSNFDPREGVEFLEFFGLSKSDDQQKSSSA